MTISLSTQNTYKGFLGLQNGLSVWFTRLHNHGEDCWSDSCTEDNHWHPSQGGKTQTFITKEAVHRVLYPSMLTESWVEGKDAQPTERTRSLMRIVNKINSRIWVNFTGMDWGWGQGIKSTTHRRVEEFGYSCHQRRLTWAKRRRTGLLPSGPKSSFQMRASFVFHLETKVLESGGRVEKLIAKLLEVQC